jgi:sec-independent protein translocase protein TatB
MFDIGWSELVVIGIVALIVIGPKELPGVLRSMGHWIGKVRRMAADFQGQFQEAMREAEMADLKKQVDEFADSTRDLTKDFDPVASMQETFEESVADKPKVAEPNPPAAGGEAAAPTAEPAPEAANVSALLDGAPAVETAAEPEPAPKAAAGGHPA